MDPSCEDRRVLLVEASEQVYEPDITDLRAVWAQLFPEDHESLNCVYALIR
jgi:hypothetical protein